MAMSLDASTTRWSHTTAHITGQSRTRWAVQLVEDSHHAIVGGAGTIVNWTMSDEEQRKPPYHQREIAWGSIFSGAALALSIGGAGIGAYDGIQRDLTDLRLAIASNTLHRTEHDKTAAIWISQIVENEQAIHGLSREVSELRSMPSARPDPFTGTDGRKLEQRIRDLESQK